MYTYVYMTKTMYTFYSNLNSWNAFDKQDQLQSKFQILSNTYCCQYVNYILSTVCVTSKIYYDLITPLHTVSVCVILEINHNKIKK